MKERLFINFTNHAHEKWGKKQMDAAEKYGKVVSIPFPSVPSEYTEQDIKCLAERSVTEILKYEPAAVLCQGEFTLTYHVVKLLKEYGIRVMAACSDRIVIEKNGMKLSKFDFVQFREY